MTDDIESTTAAGEVTDPGIVKTRRARPPTGHVEETFQVNLWLRPDVVTELDELVASKSNSFARVTRSSLIRHWIAKGLEEAKRDAARKR
jgi:hypothetical protein